MIEDVKIYFWNPNIVIIAQAIAIKKVPDKSTTRSAHMFYSNLTDIPPILDFEASSLSDTSYPISAGLLYGGKIYYWLIKPQTDWIDWSLASQAIHGIKRSTLLDTGCEANQVSQELQTILMQEPVIYSDNPYWEQKWLNCLGQFSQEIRDIHTLIPTCEPVTVKAVRVGFFEELQLTPHRADHDALALGLTIHKMWSQQ